MTPCNLACGFLSVCSCVLLCDGTERWTQSGAPWFRIQLSCQDSQGNGGAVDKSRESRVAKVGVVLCLFISVWCLNLSEIIMRYV